MKDVRTILLTELGILLEPIGLPVLSTIPDNHPNPFIFIGEVELTELPDKTAFLTLTNFIVELYTGTQAWTGSLIQPLIWVNQIKEILQPTKRSVMDLSPDFQMITLKLEYDTGLTAYSTTERLYLDRLQYMANVREQEGFTGIGIITTEAGEGLTTEDNKILII